MSPFNGKLVIVSNREPYVRRKGKLEKTAGGLVSALDPIMQKNGGIWIAAGSGERSPVGDSTKTTVPPDAPAYVQKSIWLKEAYENNYYHGYSNRFLWPLCHMTLDRVFLRRAYWSAYKKVNSLFAEAVLEETGDEPAVVWLQDYHLSLCARDLKEKNRKLVVLQFWHIPWPPHDIFRICPQRKEILEGLLANDLIGFHLDSFCQNFMTCVDRELGAGVDFKEGFVHYKGHTTRVKAFPISIDFEWFARSASSPKARRTWERFRKTLKLPQDGYVGVGVDRLEYTKGLIKRLEAIDLFFTKYPRYRRRFTFIQIAVPTRKVEPYLSYREKVEALVAKINAHYGEADWEPIKYIDYKLSHDDLAAIYDGVDLAVVSSIYDGMNLVAKEYIASQVDEKGVLLLSEFAGAAEAIPGAMLINPYDTECFADAIKQALQLPASEKQKMIRASIAYLREHDIYRWVGDILDEVERLK
ncbi:MAG: trehalose-6-phosphate synthase [Nitrospirota bacterium]|nr:trehalose-6-phosphate synthase [Nitrospirota bacterium]